MTLIPRPKLWGPILLRGPETNDVENGDLRITFEDGALRLAVLENNSWVSDAYARTWDTWRMIMKAYPTERTGHGEPVALDPELQAFAPPFGQFAVRGRCWVDMLVTATSTPLPAPIPRAQVGFRWRHVGPPGSPQVRIRRSTLAYGGNARPEWAIDEGFSTADVIVIGTGGLVEFDGVITTGATAATFGIAWAPTLDDTATMLAGSYFEFKRLREVESTSGPDATRTRMMAHPR